MVEVLFGESEAGSMKIAKSTQNSEDSYKVICLGFMMDIGDIKESVNSQYRKDLICSMYVQDQWGGDEELNEEYILPAAFDPRVGKAVAAAVAEAARKTGVARI